MYRHGYLFMVKWRVSICVRVHARVRVCLCACACVRERVCEGPGGTTGTHTFTCEIWYSLTNPIPGGFVCAD